MKPLGEVLRLSTNYLADRGDTQARRHAEELLSWVLDMPRLDLYLQFDRPLNEEELVRYRKCLQRKGKGEPVEYIREGVNFGGCQLSISPAVLIPRPETEILLSKALERLACPESLIVWDVCCGSGCLGLGVKKQLPDFVVTLSDCSAEVLAVAKQNSTANQLSVEFLQGDLLDPFKGRRAHAIFCNPPYISKKDYDILDRSVKDFEPALALVGGEDGLEFFTRLSRILPEYLHPGAKVFFEIGSTQGEGVWALFQDPCWKKKTLEKDWAGHDRFFFLEFE